VSHEPTFSVLLPAKGRPHLVREALLSILEQSYRDFEVIVSNNGADPAVRDSITDILRDPRVRYLEQQRVLPMPEHWELISLLACGRYLTVLTDRSVLKQGALAAISDLHASGGPAAEIVTWSWDLYYDDVGILLPLAARSQSPAVLESATIAIDSLRIGVPYPYALPRGLNSSVSLDLVREIRNKAGTAFSPLNPDFSFAYACLMVHPWMTHLDRPLMISQGLDISNGGNAYRTDASNYIGTLGLQEPIRYSPIKAIFVENLIAEDFFAACHRFERHDLLAKFDPADLFMKCCLELNEKQSANILPSRRIKELTLSLETALAKQSPSVRERVNAFMKQPATLKIRLRRGIKKLLGGHAEQLRPALLRLRGGRRINSVLIASGHRTA
jgi:hypothetical protein